MEHVRETYAEFAKAANDGGTVKHDFIKENTVEEYSKKLGYSENDLNDLPDDANLALGCGNPTAIASLKEGEVVIDLGSGPGFDCFIAAKKVGPTGRVIGVDMTKDMIELATKNAAKGNYTNVEFHLGEIEALPVADGIADVIISNCVVNLSPNKEKVFKEAARVLKCGGQIAISDLVAVVKQPESFKCYENSANSWLYSSMEVEPLRQIIEAAGFRDVQVNVQKCSREYIANWVPGSNAEDYISAAQILATKI